MTTTEISAQLANIEKLLERLVVFMEKEYLDDDASVVEENNPLETTNTNEAVDELSEDESFQRNFKKYGTYDEELSLREYGYALSDSRSTRTDAIMKALEEHTIPRVYYRLKALHKVWNEKVHSRNDTYVKNLENDLEFVKTNYMN